MYQRSMKVKYANFMKLIKVQSVVRCSCSSRSRQLRGHRVSGIFLVEVSICSVTNLADTFVIVTTAKQDAVKNLMS